jgi:hypothetical protein
MAEFRKRKGSDTWHWCTNCSNWPTGKVGVDFDVRYTRPSSGELDNQCLAKEKDKSCTTKS